MFILDTEYPICGTGITFNEVPDHTAYFISFGNCQKQCKGCHSKYLWYPAKVQMISLKRLLEEADKRIDSGANAICIMGGDYNWGVSRASLTALIIEMSYIAPVCLYSSSLEKEYATLAPLRWIKTGEFIQDLGGLSSPTTNQKFYEVVKNSKYTEQNALITHVQNSYGFIDLTHRFKGGTK